MKKTPEEDNPAETLEQEKEVGSQLIGPTMACHMAIASVTRMRKKYENAIYIMHQEGTKC